MRDSLSSCSTVTAGAGDVWHSSGEEEVVEADLLGPQLYQQRAFLFCEALMEPEYLLSRRRCVSVCRSAFGVFTPLCYPCPLCLCLAPSLHRRPYGEQLGRRICWLLTAAVLPPSGSFLGRSVDGLVSGYAHVGWYPSDGHCPSVVLEFLDLLCDVREDVGA